MSTAAQNRARELRAGLKEAPAESVGTLVDFASEFAIAPRLRHASIVLKLEYERAQTPAAKDRSVDAMLALLDDVVADHEAHADSEATRRAQAERKELYARYREMVPERPVAFVAENLGQTYGRSGFSLKGVNLTLRLGEITGVVGENGNGKTTLFRLIAGELHHNSGTLRYPLVDGYRRTNWIRVYQHLAYVPQELTSWYGSLADNLRYEAAIHGVTGDANDREFEYIIERLGLREHLDKRWSELSGGFKLRFALAKALIWKPKLLLLDEPLGNLDIKAQQTVLTDIRDLSTSLRYPMAVLLSSQHLHEVEAVSTNILFLTAGRIEYYGPVADIGSARKVNTFELGSPSPLREIRRALTDARYRNVSSDGISYIVTTSLETKGEDVIRDLSAAGVKVDYYRDISSSIKKLFH